MLFLQVDSLQSVTTPAPTEQTLSLLELATKGGWIMIVLGVLSIISVYLFIDRFIAIRKAQKEQRSFMDSIKGNIFSGKIDQALDLCKTQEGPLARMIEKGVNRIGRPLGDVSAAIENVGKQEVARLEKGLPLLATIAGGAPMLGFLGTVTGMVKAFYDMQTRKWYSSNSKTKGFVCFSYEEITSSHTHFVVTKMLKNNMSCVVTPLIVEKAKDTYAECS